MLLNLSSALYNPLLCTLISQRSERSRGIVLAFAVPLYFVCFAGWAHFALALVIDRIVDRNS
jgi:hypothetical protein